VRNSRYTKKPNNKIDEKVHHKLLNLK
jgi:hypothetical protein